MKNKTLYFLMYDLFDDCYIITESNKYTFDQWGDFIINDRTYTKRHICSNKKELNERLKNISKQKIKYIKI